MISRCITVFLLLTVITFYSRTFAIEEDELLKLKNTFISKDEPDIYGLKDVGSHAEIQKHKELRKHSTLPKRHIKDSDISNRNIAKNVAAITKKYEKQNNKKEFRQRRVQGKHEGRKYIEGQLRQRDRKSNFHQRKTSKVRIFKRRKTRRHFTKRRRRKSRVRKYIGKIRFGSIRTNRRKYKRHNLRKIHKIQKYTRRTNPMFYRYGHKHRKGHIRQYDQNRTKRRKYKRHNLRKIHKIQKYTRRTNPTFYRYGHKHRKGHIRQYDRNSNFHRRKTSKVRHLKRRKAHRHFSKPRRRKSRVRKYIGEHRFGSIRTNRGKYKRQYLRKRIHKIHKFTRRANSTLYRYRYRHSRRWQHRAIARNRYLRSVFLPDRHHYRYKFYKDEVSPTQVRGLESFTPGNRRWSPLYEDWSHKGTPHTFGKRGIISIRSSKRQGQAWNLRTYHARTWHWQESKRHRRRHQRRESWRQRKRAFGGFHTYAFIHRHRYYSLIQNRHRLRNYLPVYRHSYFNSGKNRNPCKSNKTSKIDKSFHQNDWDTRRNNKSHSGIFATYSRNSLKQKGVNLNVKFKEGNEHSNIKYQKGTGDTQKQSTSNKHTLNQKRSNDSKSIVEHPWIGEAKY